MTDTARADESAPQPDEAADPRAPAASSRLDGVLFALVVVALLGIASWRATLGVDFFDSAHYAAVSLRLAQGARPFTDEMTLQATGFLVPAVFAKAWTAVFGITGLELALRLFYVVLAACAGTAAYRALAPSFGRWPALAAVAAPLLAPPYNLLAPSYNTITTLALLLGSAFALAAVRDRDGRAAGLAGAAFAFAGVSYPPLVIGAAVATLAFLLVARDRRLALGFLGGGLAVAAASVAYLLDVTSVADIRLTLLYSHAEGGLLGPFAKFSAAAPFMVEPFVRASAIPMWALVVIAAVPPVPRRLRALALALLPLAVGIPALLDYRPPSQGYVGVVPAVMFVTLCVALAVPVVSWAVARRRRELLVLLAVAGPVGLADYALVLYSTSAGYHRGTPFVGLAPLAMALVAGWGVMIGELGGGGMLRAAVVTLLALTVVMLFATVFRDETPGRLTARVPSGAFAGILTTPERAADIAAIQRRGSLLVGPNDPVLVLGGPAGYLLAGGRMDTNAVWWPGGPSGAYTLQYLEHRSDPPKVVLVADDVSTSPGELARDPLLSYVLSEFRHTDDAGGFRFFVRR